MNDNYFTTHQAAKLLNVSIRTIQLWCDSGDLKHWVSPGGHRRIEKGPVLDIMKDHMNPSAPDNSNRKRILVVEDDSDLQLLYRMNFKRWELPVDVTYAPDGFIGLVEIGRQQPDLLITDLLMPNLDGFKMTKSLNHAGIHIPTLVITGASKADIDKIQEADENLLVLTKPVDFGMLRRLIATTLDIRKTDPSPAHDK